MNFMFWCLEDIYTRSELADSGDSKKVKIDNSKLTVTQKHLLRCNYSPSSEDFSILTGESNYFKLKIMESLLIARDNPVLNKANSLLPSELF